MEQSNARSNLEEQLKLLINYCKNDQGDLEASVKRVMDFLDVVYNEILELVNNKEIDIYVYNTYYSNLLVEFHSGYIDSVYLNLSTRRKIFSNICKYIESDKFKLKILSRVLKYYHQEVNNNGK